MVAGLAFRNLYREGAPSLHAILLTADAFEPIFSAWFKVMIPFLPFAVTARMAHAVFCRLRTVGGKLKW